MPDRQRRALAGRHDQVVLALEEKGERKGALEPVERLERGLDRAGALGHVMFGQQGDGFGVGVGPGLDPRLGQFGAQFAVVFDDAVVDHGDATGLMGVGVVHRGRAVGGPAGVPDTGLPGQRVVHQQIAEIDQLAHGAAAVQPAVIHRGDAGAVIAAIFQPLERLHQDRGGFVLAQYADNAAHQFCPFCLRAFFARSMSISRCA